MNINCLNAICTIKLQTINSGSGDATTTITSVTNYFIPIITTAGIITLIFGIIQLYGALSKQDVQSTINAGNIIGVGAILASISVVLDILKKSDNALSSIPNTLITCMCAVGGIVLLYGFYELQSTIKHGNTDKMVTSIIKMAIGIGLISIKIILSFIGISF